MQILKEGLKEPEYGGKGVAPLIVEVERRDSVDLARTPPRLPVHVAYELLRRPLQLLLENGRSDWGFLQRIAPLSWRDRLRRALERGWIEERNAGGITELPKILQQDVASDRSVRLEMRTWAMFDSDAREPNCPSDDADLASRACAHASVAYHQLERRTIENYLPREVLLDWASRALPENMRGVARQRVLAYFEMGPAQRHHYSLKSGFEGDNASLWRRPGERKRRKGIAPIYDGLPDHIRRTLSAGLNKDLETEVTDIFRHDEYQIGEPALVSESFEAERARIFQSIFGRL